VTPDPRPTFDLQSHSLHSDGALPPAEVVARAARAGVTLLALTDHDSVDGVDEALEEATRHAITVVPAAEISAVDDDAEDLHILGYGFDHHDAALQAALEDFREDRTRRAQAMIERLEELGLHVDRSAIAQRGAEGKAIGRPHIAAAVHRHPGNAERLAKEGRAGEPSQALVAYLIPGAPAYVRRTRPTVAEAIAFIHAAGGVAVWAHPFWDIEDPERVKQTLARFTEEAGLDGVEAFYATHTEDQTILLADQAADLNLLTTGSADFHGPDHPLFSTFRAFDLHGREPRLGSVVMKRS